MVECVDRVRKKIDKFLDLIYKSNPKNRFIKSDTVDINDKTPRVFTRNKTIQQCINNDIDFYYIDTGYMGCYPDKNWHRFVKNNFQTLSHATYAELDFLCNMNILKKRFSENTELGKELALYNILCNKKFNSDSKLLSRLFNFCKQVLIISIALKRMTCSS